MSAAPQNQYPTLRAVADGTATGVVDLQGEVQSILAENADLRARVETLEQRLRMQTSNDKLPCGGCGGPHQFDTSIPSVVWNGVIRARGLSEYLCTTCIVREFVRAGVSFTAELYGDGFSGEHVELRVGGQVADDASRVSDENNRLRVEKRQAEAERDKLGKALALLVSRVYGGSPSGTLEAFHEAKRVLVECREAGIPTKS